MRRIDSRSLIIMLVALAIGLAWASYNLASAGTVRNDSTVRPLVWAVFATPAALFLGWLLARRSELGLAALACFCLYFFSFFVAQRIETIFISGAEASANAHSFYFMSVIALHALVGLGLIIWRVRSAPPLATA